jgi:tetratricopeptide (TPR) repeat protein
MPLIRMFVPMGIALLLTLMSGPVRAAEGSAGVARSLPASALPAACAARARQFLSTGQTDQAERLVRAALTAGTDDSLLCLSGEIQFRRANFVEAARAYEAAIVLNPDNARAWWGLGRIEQAHFRGQRARDLFSKAFSLNPRDTDIILAYAEFVTEPASKSILLDNVARLANLDQPDRAGRAVAQRQIHERLQGRLPSRLVSPYAAYRLPLTGFRPTTAAQAGILVSARINGSKPLRLLLDTGARGITVNAGAARNLGLETIAASRLGGFGDAGADESRVALARTVTFGDLAFEECIVEISGRSLTTGADGVLGADVFERFRIGVDARAGVLQLTPFDDSPRETSHPSVAAIGIRHLLLVKTRVEGGNEGLFLVDTGAAFTAVSREYLPPILRYQGQPVEMRGAQGPLAGALRVAPLVLHVGGLPVVENAPLAVDLRSISQVEGIEIAGILGYSMLGRSPFTLDLRNGVVEFAGILSH